MKKRSEMLMLEVIAVLGSIAIVTKGSTSKVSNTAVASVISDLTALAVMKDIGGKCVLCHPQGQKP
jgi:uncharacterized protein YkvS